MSGHALFHAVRAGCRHSPTCNILLPKVWEGVGMAHEVRHGRNSNLHAANMSHDLESASQPLLQPEGASEPNAPGAEGTLGKLEHWSKQLARSLYAGATHLGTAILLGLITGFCLKTIGQTIAVALVLLFLGFQVLAYYGFVNFQWSAIGNALGSSIGNKMQITENGKLDLKRVRSTLYTAVAWMLSWGLLSIIGFLGGFWTGWKIL